MWFSETCICSNMSGLRQTNFGSESPFEVARNQFISLASLTNQDLSTDSVHRQGLLAGKCRNGSSFNLWGKWLVDHLCFLFDL